MKNLITKNKKALEKIFKKEGVILAYLFGSAVREKTGPLSDIDIAVLFSSKIKKGDYFDKELHLATMIGRLFKIDRVDIINLETAESPLLKHEAVFGGSLIFAKDKKVRLGIENQIMKEYEDTKHLRETQNEIMRRQIKEGTFGKPIFLPYSKYLEKYVSC